MKTILIIEDDETILGNLQQYLESEGYSIKTSNCYTKALEQEYDKIDIVILDWMLPDGQGIDLVREIKGNNKLPIIMLTARVDITDKVLGLEMGADDYLTKPFDPRELIARIRVQLRKINKNSSKNENIIEFSNINMNLKSRKVEFFGSTVRFNKMEFDLLKFLMQRPNIVFSRQELLDQVWGMDAFPTTRTVDQHILSLRNKLDSNLIETIRGVGYRLK